MQHEITGAWMSADSSRNHLEVAKTKDPQVLAIRDSFDPARYIFATPHQLRELGNAIEHGSLKTLVPA